MRAYKAWIPRRTIPNADAMIEKGMKFSVKRTGDNPTTELLSGQLLRRRDNPVNSQLQQLNAQSEDYSVKTQLLP